MEKLDFANLLVQIYQEAGEEQVLLKKQILYVLSKIGLPSNIVNNYVDNNGKMRYNKDVGDEDGAWRTTEEGHKIHINENGAVDKGNPKVLEHIKDRGGRVATSRGKGKSEFGTRYSSESRTNTGKSYPKLKDGAVYEEDTINEVNRLAAGNKEEKEPNRDKEYDEVLSRLSENDVVYQTDPDGTVVGAIPGVSQMFNSKIPGKSAEVQAAYDRRVAEGKSIVNDMVEVSADLGSRMIGLENCYKSGSSTARKIDKVKNKYGLSSDEEALAAMDDIVRFTFKCDHDNMKRRVLDLESALKDKGYEILERDNKYLPNPDGTPRDYKAVHLKVKAPNGERCEVQVHSEETTKVKNQNHKYYEEDRKLKRGDPETERRHQELQDVQIANWQGLRDPKDIQSLPSYKKQKQR